MTAIELMTKLNELPVEEWATVAATSGVAGAKDVYIAMGKSHSIPLKELEAWWKAAQPAKKASGAKGFAAEYYDWLAEDSRTEQEAHDYIMGDSSANVRNHLTHYLNIWALCETVRAGKQVSRTISASGKASPKPKAEKKAKEPEWVYDSAHPYGDTKSAWHTLKLVQQSKRPAKTKVHPDKVAHLNDAELTAAYTKAFQVYNK